MDLISEVKIICVGGTSLGVILPIKCLNMIGLRKGSPLNLYWDNVYQTLILQYKSDLVVTNKDRLESQQHKKEELSVPDGYSKTTVTKILTTLEMHPKCLKSTLHKFVGAGCHESFDSIKARLEKHLLWMEKQKIIKMDDLYVIKIEVDGE